MTSSTLQTATTAAEGDRSHQIFDRLAVLSDPIRCRLVVLLESQELTVGELCAVLQLPQSTTSRHLKVLLDDGWISARRDGTSRRYAALPAHSDPSAQNLWQTVREQVVSGAAAAQDRRRLEGVLANRRTRSQEFFSTAAGEWAGLRSEMFGGRFDLLALLGLLDESTVVGDLGCGTGQLAHSLSPFVRRIVAIDGSEQMLRAARQRLGETTSVELRHGRLEELPVTDGELDAALLVLVLHHLADPARVIAEAARGLASGGRLLIVDMLPHDREEYRQQMGHVWLGFQPEQIRAWVREAGLIDVNFVELPADASATGPTLFSASAKRPPSGSTSAGGTP